MARSTFYNIDLLSRDPADVYEQWQEGELQESDTSPVLAFPLHHHNACITQEHGMTIGDLHDLHSPLQ